ncbi:MAG: hypothetical protein JWN18_80 [Parcubacteria group bacterium]|nr:hypothetical protein [Parcubacteria group bacterium]
MNNNLIIGGIVVVVVLLGGGYYFMHQNGVQSVEQTNGVEGSSSTTTTTTTVSGEKFNGSFTELASRTGSWKCTIDATASGTGTTGTTYVSSGKVRGDFTTSTSNNGTFESHLISDGQYSYTWSSMMPQGIKIKMTADQTGIAANGATSGSASSANSSYAYNCEPWTADASLFVAPASVTFMTVPQQ